MYRNIQPLFILVFLSYGSCSEFKQEKARILYVKPNFAKDYSILTIRQRRNSPYLTTLKFTLLQSLGNNVTIRFEFANDKTFAYPIRLEYKTCDLPKLTWIQDWLKAYSNIPLSKCPILPGVYELSKFEMPPKNFPIDFSKMDYVAKAIILMTDTKEKLAELYIELKVDSKKG